MELLREIDSPGRLSIALIRSGPMICERSARRAFARIDDAGLTAMDYSILLLRGLFVCKLEIRVRCQHQPQSR
ncbi:MAG: hypothetical protein QOJ64_961 [Acidobacteriota bacterium]|nr:hypothetical protein [Acidobacteriota bacterium]